MRRFPFNIQLNIQPRSVRTRLMIWNIGVLALLLMTLGGIVQFSTQNVLQGSVDSDLRKEAASFGAQGREMLLREQHIDPRWDGGFGPPGFRLDRGHGEFDFPPPDAPQGHHGPHERHGPDDFGGREGGPGDGPPPGPPHESLSPLQRSNLEQQRRQSPIPRVFNTKGIAMRPFQNAGMWDPKGFKRALQNESDANTIIIDGEPTRVFSRPVLWRNQVIGVVQARHPFGDDLRAITSMNRVLLTLIPVGLLLAGLAGAAVTSRALKPVEEIAQTADQIDAQDWTQRLPAAGSDEFSHLAHTFNRMLDRLEGAFAQQQAILEQQRRFTADASHELKTPLAVSKVHTGLLLHAPPNPEEYTESVEAIDHAVDRMSRLVQDLLLLAQNDAGQLDHAKTSLVVRDLLEHARHLQHGWGRPAIHLDQVDPVLTVLGNEDQLERVFSNLLGNALRHTPPEGEIRVCAEQCGEQIIIRIADTGEGIAPEHLPHLGERFYRIDSARSRGQGGSGLGLSICKSLLEQNQGSLSFESVLGQGTTAIVTLPAEKN